MSKPNAFEVLTNECIDGGSTRDHCRFCFAAGEVLDQAAEIERLEGFVEALQAKHTPDPEGRPRLMFDSVDMENRRIRARLQGWREACEACGSRTLMKHALTVSPVLAAWIMQECAKLRDQGPPE